MERNLHATQPDPRFWNIAVRRERITITSGPLHTPGTARHIDCKSNEVALKTAQALVDQRLKDGFRDAAVGAPAATVRVMVRDTAHTPSVDTVALRAASADTLPA
jgi:predicted DNA-binding WGR domain protein